MPISHHQRRLLGRSDHLLEDAPHQHGSIRGRILWHSLLLAGFTVMVLSLLSSVVALSLVRNRVLGQLSSVVASRENLLSRSLQYDRERTALLAADVALLQGLASGNGHPLEPLWERLLREQVPVRGMMLLDVNGKEVDAAGERFALPSPLPRTTLIVPALNRQGKWETTDVFAPVRDQQRKTLGLLAMRYDPSFLLRLISDNPSLGPTGELLLLRDEGGFASIVFAYSGEKARRSSGDIPVGQFVIPEAVRGAGGYFAGKDEWGGDILAAYQHVPTAGWGMVIKVDTHDALSGWERFVNTLLLIDLFLLSLTGVVGVILARQLSFPILELAGKMRRLTPRSWNFQRSIRTGDEVEFLDTVAAELTSRLRAAYGHLEDEVEARTEELKKQYLLDRTILEHIEYGVFVVDANSAVIDANPSGLQLLGKKRDEVVGADARKVLRFFRKNEPLLEEEHPVFKALRKRESFHFYHGEQITLLARKDSILPVTLAVTPLVEKRRLHGAIVIVEDIREENRIDEMKSDFIALASHQLRTPLSSLRWYLELMNDEKTPVLSDIQQSYISQIEHAAQRMVNLLDDLLRITRLEGGEIRAEKRRFDLRKMLLELQAEWQPIATERKMTCDFTFPRRAIHITSDPILLHLVLQNLFTNAMKYSPEGTRIQISVQPLIRTVVLQVSDNGMGIPTEEQSHVFEKFFRAKNAKRADADGSGLGLYLTRMIVENLDGHIAFKSVTGKGTTFTVKLPLK